MPTQTKTATSLEKVIVGLKVYMFKSNNSVLYSSS